MASEVIKQKAAKPGDIAAVLPRGRTGGNHKARPASSVLEGPRGSSVPELQCDPASSHMMRRKIPRKR
ncbi:unnamed protein product [Pylaiella littoralis]